MGLDVYITPSPLPVLQDGESVVIRISLNGARPGEPVCIELFGAERTDGSTNFPTLGHQAFTTVPSIQFMARATKNGSPTVIVSSPDDRFPSVTINGSQPSSDFAKPSTIGYNPPHPAS